MRTSIIAVTSSHAYIHTYLLVLRIKLSIAFGNLHAVHTLHTYLYACSRTSQLRSSMGPFSYPTDVFYVYTTINLRICNHAGETHE